MNVYTPAVRRRIVLQLLLIAAVCAAPAAPCEYAGVPRVVAVGDVHGTYDGFVQVLQLAGVVDGGLRWSGGKAHLVQVGDVPDRGPDSRKVMDLLMRLEKEAAKAGGRVHALLGNHEVMNMIRDLRYVSAGEYEAFRTRDSEVMREEVYRRSLEEARRRAKAEKTTLDEAAFRERFLKQAPLGYVEHRRAFAPEGTYGRWLRRHDAVVKINGVVFVHGGLTPEVAALGCKGINDTIRREMTADLDRTRDSPLQSLSGREDGPLWYRGLAREDEATLAPKVDEVLRALGARAVVVGHTPRETGRIEARLGGRVVLIDVGMLPAFGGHLAALEITPEGMTALYPDRREILERTPAAAALGR